MNTELFSYGHPSKIDSCQLTAYIDLLNSAAKPTGTIGCETHHRLPRCLGGSDNPTNLVLLTYRDHLIAHYLLWKAYEPAFIEGSGRAVKIGTAFCAMVNIRLPCRKGWVASTELTPEMLSSYESAKVAARATSAALGRAATQAKTGIHAQSKKEKSDLGRAVVEARLGVHSQSREQLIAAGHTGAALSVWQKMFPAELEPDKVFVTQWWDATVAYFIDSDFAKNMPQSKMSLSPWVRAKFSNAGRAAQRNAADAALLTVRRLATTDNCKIVPDVL